MQSITEHSLLSRSEVDCFCCIGESDRDTYALNPIVCPICRSFVHKLQVGIEVKYNSKVVITEVGKGVLYAIISMSQLTSSASHISRRKCSLFLTKTLNHAFSLAKWERS